MHRRAIRMAAWRDSYGVIWSLVANFFFFSTLVLIELVGHLLLLFGQVSLA
jgi:hypothetical protein